MFCRSCGAEIAPGAKFCAKCGTPVVEAPSSIQDAGVQIPVTDKKENSVNQKVQPAEAVSAVGGLPPLVIEDPKKTGPANSSSTSNALTIVIVAVIVLVVIGLAVLIGIKVVIPMLDKGEKQMVYMEDGDLYYLKDMTKPDKAIKVDSTRDMSYAAAKFSEDGKYLYYYSEYDDSNYTYTLNCVKLSKLKKSGDNDKYIEKIASDVESYEIADSGAVYYLDSDRKLIEYKNGKEKALQKHVDSYVFSKDQSMIYCDVSDGSDSSSGELCVVDIAKGESKTIDDEIDGFSLFYSSNDFIVYYKYTGDAEYEEMDVYAVKGDKEPVCVVEDAWYVLEVDAENETIYYEKKNSSDKTLYDFVNDSKATEDEGVTEPVLRDALVEVSEDDALNACLSEYEQEEYLTGKKKDLKKYYEQMYYDDSEDLYYDYSEDYYDTYYYDEGSSKWYMYDSDLYDEKYDAYYAVADRINLRESLQESVYTVNEYDLYSVSLDQKAKEICTGASSISVSAKDKLAIYKKAGENIEKKDITEIESTGDIYDYLDTQYQESKTTYYRIGTGEEQVLEVEGDVYVADNSGDGKLVLSGYDSTGENYDEYIYYYCEVGDKKLSKLEQITDEGYGGAVKWLDGTLYYLSEYDSEEAVADVYRYKNGKSEKVLEEVSTTVAITEDGNYITSDGDLLLYNSSGKDERIAKDVLGYSYLAKDKIVYTADDDLYLFDGKEEIRIVKDVQGYVIYIQQMGKDVADYRLYYPY